MMIDAIITAGGIPQENELLYPFTQGKNKALLDVAGKPMIQWILDALNATDSVRRIVVVGLPLRTVLESQKPLTLLDNAGDMLSNVRKGCRAVLDYDSTAVYGLLVSSDVPAFTPPMIEWIISQVSETTYDFYYCLIEQSVMLKRYPESHRTYLALKDMTLCGADVHIIRLKTATQESKVWNRLAETRKSPLKQMAIFGLDILWLILTNQVTLAKGEALLNRKLGLKGKIILSPYAELGMDVDKPGQLEMVRADLAARS